MSKIEHSISEKISKYGVPLKEWNVQITFGVKTGFNDAFIITEEQKRQLIRADEKSEEIIRPILRGRDIGRFRSMYADLHMICTFPSKNYDIDDYPSIKKHLLSFGIERLEQTGATHVVNGEKIKSRKKTNNKWFETQDSISYWDDFNKQKIVWARLSRISKHDFYDFPRFAIVPEGFVTLDSLCFFTGERLNDLVSFLNSRYAAYYFFNTVAILDNGGMQMRQQYVENIPLPNIQISQGASETEIDELIFEAFHFTKEETTYIKSFLEMKKKEIEESRG